MINRIVIDSILLEFGTKRVLDNVYFKSEPGKITGLLGRNGTGKSCLMKIIFGELIPNNKSIRINGKPIYSTYRHPQDLRYLPQVRFVPNSLTIKRIFKDFKLNFADLVYNFPVFKNYYKSRLKDLSGGERRIVEIYIILVAKTKFCMLDEPFSQVMPIHIESIKKLILREKENKGIIITDHMYKHIIDICDDLYVISNGQVYLTNKNEDIETLGYVRFNQKSDC